MDKPEKIILGIDPGTATMGYGVIEYKNSNIKHVTHGTLNTDSGLEDHIRLKELYASLIGLIEEHRPDAVGVEDIFYFKNKKTVITVSQARGIALLAAANKGVSCYSFTPLQIKQAVAGWGQADKKQVQQMVKTLLNLEEIPKPDDAADALAVAICCAHSLNTLSAINNQ